MKHIRNGVQRERHGEIDIRERDPIMSMDAAGEGGWHLGHAVCAVWQKVGGLGMQPRIHVHENVEHLTMHVHMVV